jgi:hypothetical protein
MQNHFLFTCAALLVMPGTLDDDLCPLLSVLLGSMLHHLAIMPTRARQATLRLR